MSVRRLILVGVTYMTFVGLCLGDEIRVSSLGFDAGDSTAFIQKALDSGAGKVILDRQSAPWVARPLFARSNTEIVLEEGVTLLAKRGEFKPVRGSVLLALECVTNVTLRGLGKGATLRMWKEDYQAAPYRHSEWRHALSIMSARNVLVENLTFERSGGDGIYLGVRERGCANTDVTIRNCVCDANHRQGISVISAENLLIEDTVMKDTSGTPPQAGIDFEPNSDTEKLVNCVMRNCLVSGNRGCGYELYLGQLSGDTEPVSVTLENCRSENDLGSALSLTFRPDRHGNRLPVGGFLKLRGCTFRDNGTCAVSIRDKPAGVMDVSAEDCVFENCPREGGRDGGGAVATSAGGDGADVRLVTTSLTMPTSTDGVSFRNVKIVRSVDRPWLKVSNRPWICTPVTKVTGEVTVRTTGTCEKIALDDAWRRRTFVTGTERLNLATVPFAPTQGVTAVDARPGETVRLSPLAIRFSGTAWVYADGPKEIVLGVRKQTVGKRRAKGDDTLTVRTAKRKKIKTLAPPAEKDERRTFKVPRAGFYAVAFDVGSGAIVFTESNVPIGLVGGKKGFDVYHATKPLYFHHAGGADAAVFCGGSGEPADAVLRDPAGVVRKSWTGLKDWGFAKIGAGEAGLWRLDFARPVKEAGSWEDAYVRLTGMPSVFFLSNEKYWLVQAENGNGSK